MASAGASDVAPRSLEILEDDQSGVPLRLTGDYQRDEAGQTAYLAHHDSAKRSPGRLVGD